METIIVAAIVVLALAYLVRRFYRGFKTDAASACAGGCGGCAAVSSCAEAGTCGSNDPNRLS